MTPKEFFESMIIKWEGGYQDSVSDHANFTPNGKLLGTMRGVTPAAYANYLGVGVESLTVAEMKTVTVEMAANIGLDEYYSKPGWNKLPWCPATAFFVDWAWHSGPTLAKKKMQSIIMVGTDGIIGPRTVNAYCEWLQGMPTMAAAQGELIQSRMNFLRKLVARRPGNQRFLAGWNNRVQSFAVGTDWWKSWDV